MYMPLNWWIREASCAVKQVKGVVKPLCQDARSTHRFLTA
jgi:hypothetical protein